MAGVDPWESRLQLVAASPPVLHRFTPPTRSKPMPLASRLGAGRAFQDGSAFSFFIVVVGELAWDAGDDCAPAGLGCFVHGRLLASAGLEQART